MKTDFMQVYQKPIINNMNNKYNLKLTEMKMLQYFEFKSFNENANNNNNQLLMSIVDLVNMDHSLVE